MLPAAYRLRGAHDLIRARSKGRRFVVPAATIYLYDRADGLPPRFACLAGRRVARRAVDRHRYQRLLRAACAQLLGTKRGALLSGYDVVLVARHNLGDYPSSHAVGDDIRRILASYLTRGR